jgi:mRNA interferase YafQ
MMRKVIPSTKFRRDYKRECKSDAKLESRLASVIETLANDRPLPERMRDHALSGEWADTRECHVKPDLLLIYRKDEGELGLVRLGSHSELFG